MQYFDGGEIRVWGELGKGANFVLTLPKVSGGDISNTPIKEIPTASIALRPNYLGFKQNSVVITQYLSSISAGLRSLVFDSSCIICGSGKLEFCVTCQAKWRSNPRQITGKSFKVFRALAITKLRKCGPNGKENSLTLLGG